MSYKSFEEMPLWQEAHALAAVSIAANVAEAFGRYHYRDKLRFYYNSRGSAYEVKSHLLYARDVNYIEPELFNDLIQHLDTILHDQNKIIATIRDRLSKGQ